MNKLLSGFVLSFIILIFICFPAYGQKAGIHDVGKLYVAYQDDAWNVGEGYGGIATFVYPQNFYRRKQVQLWWRDSRPITSLTL